MPIVSDHPAVIELATKLHRETLNGTKKNAALAAIKIFYDLAAQDSIWSGSPAAICMGYTDYPANEDLLERIVADVAQELPNRKI